MVGGAEMYALVLSFEAQAFPTTPQSLLQTF